ncbi:IQ motif and SEC7 domain-containing protein 1 isoform X2 [Copidosoma floridanum]|uniref:IQ motif and SEC7 domain-containing protein 1 isoform X2 n=1 Tax=Copidosoma floridanum TaxID=29053 RepID=UPI0006C9B685|nr:IQ motif and SEC7 domain-containing protein 1 isoform X2 [Copidosoma floridanum]XP_014217149.1 IQ motif and SEC7 domain-containing protein 1 isoform X2 [Copidosoma floridanum]XP_014217150.1 IQ motif and SEC7 domain-containing protein 1 isoform X2 [Copidosoma floridanum]XP_014217151.1 IQ motif and SEC7 domain-containing protein 1 isoform X2 [Copidosoma floridanum]
MYGATMVVEPRDHRGSSAAHQSLSQHHHHMLHQQQQHHHHQHYRHQMVKTTRVHQSSRTSSRVVTVQEKVIRSRLQLGYSTPTSFINRFPQKMERLGPTSKGYAGVGGGGSGSIYASSQPHHHNSHHQHQHQQQPALSSSYMTGQYMYSQNYAHAPYAGPGVQPTYVQQQYTSQPQSYGPVVQGYGGQPGQACHKKSTVRNGDVMKRCRLQGAYELSQDMLDKQIEMLERKYGGVKARNAALTIQRAFRRYTLLKKFAAITAMAKVEKRLSRKLQEAAERQEHLQDARLAYQHHNQVYVQSHQQQHYQRQQQQQSPVGRPMPTRSMSLKERRHVVVDGSARGCASPVPRGQPGRCEIQIAPAPHQTNQLANHQLVNHGVATSGRHTPSLTPSPCGRQQQQQQPPASPCWESSSQESGSSINYYNPQESLCTVRQDSPAARDTQLRSTSCTSPSTPLQQGQIIQQQTLQQQQQNNWSSSTSQLSGSSVRSVGRTSSFGSCGKALPPEVPKRTSSITSRSMEGRHNGLSKSVENGSLSSVQSSGSDSTNCESSEGDITQRGSPVWKHKAISSSPEHQEMIVHANDSGALLSNAKDLGGLVATSGSYQLPLLHHHHHLHHNEHGEHNEHNDDSSISQVSGSSYTLKASETVRKRQYRVGLNLFNKKPERGINYLMRRNFVDNSPQGVARFLISRKGLSRQMIGEYLGNLQNSFNMAVLDCFAHELDLAGMQVDVALRKFQAYFRMPGEAQKIERLMEVFSQRYCQCNPDVVMRLRSPDTIFVLAFAIIMLNTDLHTPNLKPERRMRIEDFVKNLRGIDDCGDIDKDILVGIYDRVKANEFKPGSDHVTQVMKVQATIVGKKPNMALPHRRLVCYCRLYEIPDVNKKEKPGVHQREVFLFNDLLVVTKILSKKKSSVTYTFRQSFPLCGMLVTLFEAPHYPYGIKLSQRVDNKALVTFNARNEHDRCKFVEDLRESISEMDEMETLRIETELERQKNSRGTRGSSENRDSGVADVEVCPCPGPCSERSEVADNDSQQLKRSTLSNSLLDIHEQFAGEKPQRRGSVGSLDSGMSISFQSTSASSMSQGAKASGVPAQAQPGVSAHPGAGAVKGTAIAQQPSFLGSLFHKRERKLSHSEEVQQQQQHHNHHHHHPPPPHHHQTPPLQPQQGLTVTTMQGSPSPAAPYGRTTEV